MISIKKHYVLIVTILFFSCEKELNISEFINDYNLYTPELRIEALILPNDTTAIVRIDRSFPIDEDNLFNCIDDDNDWNYYHCDEDNLSFESLDECISNCEDDCIPHLYICNINEIYDFSKTYLTIADCNSDCVDNFDGKCITDDLGEDGVETFNFAGEPEPDIGEGDGIPSCGENNVDEMNETLPNIHIKDGCNVSMTNLNENGTKTECDFVYDSLGGSFYGEENKYGGFESTELINYGAWIPSNDCDVNFRNFNTEYEFICDCQSSEEFSSYGIITAKDTLREPVIFYTYEEWDDINNNDIFDGDDTYDDWNQNNQLDTLISRLDSCSIEINTHNCLESIHSIDTLYFKEDSDAYILYASLASSSLYQAVQYIYDKINDRWVYYHGHRAGPINQLINFPTGVINIGAETVVTESYEEATFFKYDIFTFSTGYRNYYQYSDLTLDDPVRTNLRDQYGNPVMGAFGSMSGRSKYFEIIIE